MGARGSRRRALKELIDLGLRAQLNAQSLVTGLLFVQLDFHPENPADVRSAAGLEDTRDPDDADHHGTGAVGGRESLSQAASGARRGPRQVAHATVDAIKNVVATPELKETIQALPATVANLNQTVTSFRELSAHVDAKAGPLFDSLKGTSEKGGVALDQARGTMQSVDEFVKPDSPLSTELTGTLQELSAAARALRLLANYLERNPSALVRGKAVTSQ